MGADELGVVQNGVNLIEHSIECRSNVAVAAAQRCRGEHGKLMRRFVLALRSSQIRNSKGAIGERCGGGAARLKNPHAKLAKCRIQRARMSGAVMAAAFTNAQTTQLPPAIRPKIALVIYPQHLSHIAACCGLRFLRL